MPRLVWLRDHMQHSDILANWLHQQFAYEFVDQPLADWQREFAEGQGNGDWQCLIALKMTSYLAVLHSPPTNCRNVRTSVPGSPASLSPRRQGSEFWRNS